MDQQPKIPTLKDAQKPQVKVKGLGAGLTLFDRLKQFKKKDLAFILAGLGTLFMAPLAEHFMMAPENGSADMAPGFRGSGSGAGIFGSGSSPYESGNNSIAQGGAIGGAGDIITPLNVRDPSALVMGPGASQQPPAGSAAPVTPPPTAPASSPSDYKDALAGAASRAASAAVKKSPLPVPKVALGGSGLRGLGVAGGGSSASGSLGPIAGGAGGTAGTGGGGLNLVRPTPGFRSAAGARGPGNPTGLDGTKKAGQNAGDAFSRTGSALSGLNAAAAEQIPTGGGTGFTGNGQGGAGANDKGPGGNGPGGSKSVGESLAFIEAKERMMENLKLEFEKRKLKDPELLLYGIRNDSLKAMAGEVTKSLTKFGLSFLDPNSGANAASYYLCGNAEQGTAIKVGIDTPKCDGDKQKTQCMMPDAASPTYVNSAGTPIKCQKVGEGTATPNPTTESGGPTTAPNGVSAGRPTQQEAAPAATLEAYCIVARSQVEIDNGPGVVNKSNAAEVLAKLDTLVAARVALYGGANAKNACTDQDTKIPKYDGTSVADMIKEGIVLLDGDPKDAGVYKKLLDAVGEDSDPDVNGDVTKAAEKFAAAEALRKEVDTKIKDITVEQIKVNGARSNDPEVTRLVTSAETALADLKARSAETGDKSTKVTLDQLTLLAGPDGTQLVSNGAGTIGKVTKMNERYATASEDLPDAAITAANVDSAPAMGEINGGDAGQKWKTAAGKVDTSVSAAGGEGGPVSILEKAADDQKAASLPAAKTAVTNMRRVQVDMIKGLRSAVQALRAPPQAAPATGS